MIVNQIVRPRVEAFEAKDPGVKGRFSVPPATTPR
jgi:hypothetical protein